MLQVGADLKYRILKCSKGYYGQYHRLKPANIIWGKPRYIWTTCTGYYKTISKTEKAIKDFHSDGFQPVFKEFEL